MSGGYFDYGFTLVDDMSSRLFREIEKNGSQEKDEYGDPVGKGFSDETIKRVRQVARRLNFDAKMLREVEWLYSGDTGEEDFVDAVTILGIEEAKRWLKENE